MVQPNIVCTPFNCAYPLHCGYPRGTLARLHKTPTLRCSLEHQYWNGKVNHDEPLLENTMQQAKRAFKK